MARLMQAGVFFGVVLAGVTGWSQEVVHAMTGTVVKVDPGAGAFVMKPDDGSTGQLGLPAKGSGSADFNKGVRAGTVPAAKFSKLGTQVLVYYTGYGDQRTAVAVQDLGSAPLVKVVGTVVKYDKHAHLLTIMDGKGKQETFAFDSKTVAEATEGAEEGEKFHPDKGVQVRVIATGSAPDKMTALFVRALSM